MKKQVFLGGACGLTTWRREIAIPRLETAGVSYHNPQLGVGEWTQAHEALDVKAKADADVLLFVITQETRGVASIGEVAYLLGQGRPVALCLRMRTEGGAEADDLNRGRIFLRTTAEAHGVPVFDKVEDAVDGAIQLVKEGMRVSSILSGIECQGLRFELRIVNGGYHLRLAGPEGMEGRQWFLPSPAQESDVVRTAFKAAVTWQEHETREMFRYKGVAVFGPHIDVNELLKIRHP